MFAKARSIGKGYFGGGLFHSQFLMRSRPSQSKLGGSITTPAPIAALTHALIWQGKVVSRQRGLLKNKLTPLRLRLVKALVEPGPSWVDGRPCVVLDCSRTSLVARLVRDELRLVGPHLYLGVVWLGRRRVLWFTLRDRSGG